MDSPLIWLLYVGAAIAAACIAIRRIARDEHGAISTLSTRVWLTLGALLGFVPLISVAVFARAPQVPVRLFPIPVWAAIEREYWFPLAVLFFACASQLVTARNRRALKLLTFALVPFVAVVTGWRLLPRPTTDFGRNMSGGVCLQSSDYTCGAASLVTLLDAMGIDATEGEMARLSGTIPGRGVSDFQAADGLRRKLCQLQRPEHAEIIHCPGNDPFLVPPPWLASMKYSFWFDHMVCVLEVDRVLNNVVVGDPLGGRRSMAIDDFRNEWRGFAIAARPD